MKEMFLDDGREKISQFDSQIMNLEKDNQDEFALTEIYRIIHSFKGMAGTIELSSLESLFHEFETFISEIQKRDYNITNNIIDLFYDILEFVETAMDRIEKNQPYEQGIPKLLSHIQQNRDQITKNSKTDEEETDRIKSLLQKYGLENINFTSIDYESKELSFFLIEIVIGSESKLKIARLLVILKNIQECGSILRSFPPISELLEGTDSDSFKFIFQSKLSKKEIRQALERTGEILSINIEDLEPEDAKKIVTEYEDDKEIEAAELDIEDTKNLEKVDVKLDLIDKQVELFGELLISSKRLESVIDSHGLNEAKEIFFQMQQYMINLQDIILKMQLVPISTVFRPFPRMIRILSRKQEKIVSLQIRHHDVKIDRKILNQIGDITNHLVRNSISHGIELPDERLDINKPQKGTIQIETQIENNVLKLVISDDGRGVDPKLIASLAVEKSIHTQTEIAAMSDEEIRNIIFSPNFSSAKSITNVSGRGLGLNIVKKKIESLNGQIEMNTKVNVGTQFKIYLPLSKTLIRALLVKSANEIYTIALDDIDRLLQIPIEEIDNDGEKFYYTYKEDETIIEIHDLGKNFNLYTHSRLENNPKFVNVVYVKKGNKYLGLLVDSFLKESEVVIKEIDDVDVYSRGISGAAILEDGRVSLIIDPFSITS